MSKLGNTTTGIHCSLSHHMLNPADLEFVVDIHMEAPKYTSGTYSTTYEWQGTKHVVKGTVQLAGTTILYTTGGNTDKAVYNTGAGTYVSTPV